MVHFDPATGVLGVPIWLSAAVTAVIVVLAGLAFARSGALKTLVALVIVVALGYGAWIASQFAGQTSVAQKIEERRAFEGRVAELAARAAMPGSPLSCLDGSAAIEQLTSGCERILFGSPENVSAAVSHVNARLALLVEGKRIAAQSDQNYDAALAALRQGLELDRFGVVAHAMASQPNCLPEQCDLLVLLQDANKVRVNLQEKPFEALVAKYAPQWSNAMQVGSVGEPGRSPIGVTPGAAPPAPVSSRYELPSSDSIPPVSIMNSESSAHPPAAAPPAAPPAARRPPAVRAPVARSAASPEPVPLAPAPAGPR